MGAARAGRAALGCAAAGAGLCLAWVHPLWPGWATALFAGWLVISVLRPGAWLFVLPAALPWANFAPWTGWILFEEFDLVTLGAIGGGYLRWAWCRPEAADDAGTGSPRWAWTVWLFGALSAAALLRGLWGAGLVLDPFQGQGDPMNGLRLFKPLAYVLLLWPLWRRELQAPMGGAMRRLGHGMLAGLAVAVAAALWERVAFPGLLDFSAPYRTTALFWEMHVGGAAIDVYLALCVPFVAWGLWTAATLRRWLVLSLLALLTGYVCLTTYSRGVYAAVALPLVILGAVWAAGRAGVDAGRVARALAFPVLAGAAAVATFSLAFEHFGLGGSGAALLAILMLVAILAGRSGKCRTGAVYGLAMALLFEMVLVLHAGGFMSTRLAASERDFGSRQAHWRHGLGLLETPGDWVWGIGLGQLPSRYAGAAPSREFSGALDIVPALEGRQVARLHGPQTQADLGGLFAMTQRLPATRSGAYRLQLDARANAAAQLEMRVCEMHLLYALRCQTSVLQMSAGGTEWQRRRAILEGPALTAGAWYAPRLRVFAVSVLSPAVEVEIAALQLFDSDGRSVLVNADFAQGQAHWFPAAQAYFLPWHIDNLFLELLIERGLLGLLAFLAMVAAALWSLWLGSRRADSMAPFVAASIAGALIVGLVSSVLDVPRVAFLFQFLIAVGLSLGPGAKRRAPGATPDGTVR